MLPAFHDDGGAYAHVMRSSIALNGSFFNAQRMLEQYAANAYAPLRAGRTIGRPCRRREAVPCLALL